MTLPGQGFPQHPTLSTLGDLAWTRDPTAGRGGSLPGYGAGGLRLQESSRM